MKKSKSSLTFSTPFIISLIVLALGFGAVFYLNQQPEMFAGRVYGANVIREDSRCGVFDAAGHVFTTGYQAVVTESKNKNITVRCDADNVPNETGKTIKFDYESTNFPCTYWDGEHLFIGKDWQEVLTPSGNATYICHLNREDIWTPPAE